MENPKLALGDVAGAELASRKNYLFPVILVGENVVP